MKPITNILLVLALICYVFLSFYDVSFHGSVTGLEFTAGHISQSFSISNLLFALIPFITCFAGIAFNCLKNRWWVLVTMACIAVCIGFYIETVDFHEILLNHAPDITPDNDLGEGFKIIGVGLGHKLAFGLTCLSLASAVISLLPFKFNQTIEKAVDDTFEDGKRHVRDEWNRIESRHQSRKNKSGKQTSNTTNGQHTVSEMVSQPDQHEVVEDKEDPSRFMPPQEQ